MAVHGQPTIPNGEERKRENDRIPNIGEKRCTLQHSEHYFHSRSSQEKHQFPGVSWEQLGADALPHQEMLLEQNLKKNKVVMIEEKEFFEFYSYFPLDIIF